MNVLVRFLDEYATAILYAGITAFAGAAGVVLKRIGSRYFSNRTKRRVVRNCIRAVERVYGDLPEEEQYREKVKAVAEGDTHCRDRNDAAHRRRRGGIRARRRAGAKKSAPQCRDKALRYAGTMPELAQNFETGHIQGNLTLLRTFGEALH